MKRIARVEERRILAKENAELALRARAAGVITSAQFAQFFNAGYLGLYHETAAEIHACKGLKPSQDISDWMGGLELSANHFRAALARHHMDTRGIADVPGANATHQEAGASVRSFLLSQGITPEDLPTPTKSYQHLLREEEARAKLRAEDAFGLWSLLLEENEQGEKNEDG